MPAPDETARSACSTRGSATSTSVGERSASRHIERMALWNAGFVARGRTTSRSGASRCSASAESTARACVTGRAATARCVPSEVMRSPPVGAGSAMMAASMRRARTASTRLTAEAVSSRISIRGASSASCCSTRRASSSMAFPASVSETLRWVRSKSFTPSSSSSLRICSLTAGCATWRRSAARRKCSSSATATKYLRWRSSMSVFLRESGVGGGRFAIYGPFVVGSGTTISTVARGVRLCTTMPSGVVLILQVDGNRRDDDLAQRPQRSPQPRRGPAVQHALPRVADDDLGEDDGHREARAPTTKHLDVVDERRDERAEGRHDDLERYVIAPRSPVVEKAPGLITGGADVYSQHLLAERPGVGERPHAREVDRPHRDERKLVDGLGALLALRFAHGRPGRRGVEGERSVDARVVAADARAADH